MLSSANSGRDYRGRFAPSPSGPLHLGSLLAALASYADARHQEGVWLLRIEDIDTPRCVDGAERQILHTLTECGMSWDEEIVRQSERRALYDSALNTLSNLNRVFDCCCSRADIAEVGVAGPQGPIYPGTCRDGLKPGQKARSLRFRVPDEEVCFGDRVMGAQSQSPRADIGDFVLRRVDGIHAYQLAVVVDDADQQITDVVRGHDLLDSTPRQILLQNSLGLPTPRYLHVPILTHADGTKLSKQTGASGVADGELANALLLALKTLGQDCPEFLQHETPRRITEHAVHHWAAERIPAVAQVDATESAR